MEGSPAIHVHLTMHLIFGTMPSEEAVTFCAGKPPHAEQPGKLAA